MYVKEEDKEKNECCCKTNKSQANFYSALVINSCLSFIKMYILKNPWNSPLPPYILNKIKYVY